MKVTFILPAIGKKQNRPYIKTWQTMEPLTFALLKALTPSQYDCEFFDDRIELIDYSTATNLVAINCEFYTAKRAYAIARRFRERHIPVVLGGYHATLYPQEAEKYADSVVRGNAEAIWETVLADAQAERLKKRYFGPCQFRELVPDRSIFAGKHYSRLGVVEVGRGCLFQCEFCAISAFYNQRYYRKPIEYVVRDIRAAGKKYLFFADDNIVADKEYAKKLCRALIPLKIRWSGQASLDMARDGELLDLMKQSGCEMVLIGYESLDADNLAQMNKSWISRLGEVGELTRKVHRAGINIYATFVVGFDADRPGLVKETLHFAKQHNFFFAAFNHLLPVPGTPLYSRLKSERRLEDDEWWLNSDHRYGDVVFKAKQMSPRQLSLACLEARRKYFNLGQIIKRSLALFARKISLAMYFYFWYISLKLKKEVEGKFGLPLGEGLDELPK